VETLTGNIFTDILGALLSVLGLRSGVKWGLRRFNGRSSLTEPLTKADMVAIHVPLMDRLGEVTSAVKHLTTVLEERLPPPWAK
jgi:hypothetical protein